MVNKFFIGFVKLFYRKYNYDGRMKKWLLLYIFMQKIIGINRSVPWPVHWSSRVDAPGKIEANGMPIGFMPGCYIDGRNGIVLESNVIIGPSVSIISQNHHTTDFDKYRIQPPIRIGKNSWIGTHAVILPGVQLGPHTIVAAGSVVTKSFPDGDQIIAGNPAKVIKKIEKYKES
jgi:acetyltransferase-like isoleucine patch superfamily enzyme